MQIRVLGTLEVFDNGSPVPLGGLKQRTVLALLAQVAGRRVTVDELILGVYGDEVSSGARRTVQTYVSNLRHELGDVIQGTGDGYVLAVDGTAIDAGEFEAAYHAAIREMEHEPDRAAGRLLDGLALWRGHPYADVDAHGELDAEMARLQELRLAALERRVECDLALGRHRELVGELESLTAEHPFREDLRAHQILALYRAGRQGDALAAMEQARQVLGEELGIDPSPQLKQLQRRVLNQDPTLELDAGPRVERCTVLVAELDAEGWSAGRRASALTRRDEILSPVVDRGDATIIGLRGTAVFAAFPTAAVGVETAVALVESDSETTLRLALDHGAVEARDDTVTGPPVNRAARIVALAHPGQILLSADAHQTLAEGGVPGWSATALGRHAVVGIDEALALYQLHGEGIPVRFPPLRQGRVPPPVPRATLTSVPGYELRARLVAGDIDSVYRAYQAAVGREVVVRVIRRESAADPAFIRRFEAEGQRVVRLTHPYLVSLLDYWRDPEGAYMVHPLIAGGNLGQRMHHERFAPETALTTLEQIGAALSHAHAHNVVHGRLHPGNVLIDEADNLQVTDLGVVQMCDGLTASSAHAYTAPETLGGGPITVAADVHALAVLAFELLEGRQAPQDAPLPLPTTPAGEVLSRASSGDPADRYATVDAFLVELRSAITGTAASAARPLSEARNPYRGLETFQEADASDFHGREALVDELVQVLGQQRLLTVVGPSGIGKSSVVRAGLVPALRDGAIRGSARWLVADLFPSSRPFAELASALRRIAVDDVPEMTRELRSSEDGLHRCAERILPAGSDLLLVVDQFEELFTQTSDEDVRRAFLASLVAATAAPRSRVRVVITLRADFFDRPLHHASFAEVMRRGVVAVRAPRRDELIRAIREPASGVGVIVDEALAERLVSDADGQPGVLPLLQHVLAELFEARTSDRLTLAAYEAAGGLRGSVGRKAEELYLGLDGGQRGAARRLFLQLVAVHDENQDTRRRVGLAEVLRSGGDAVDLQRVLDGFGNERLLTFDRDPVTRGPTVEVAHESLLTEWDRLRGWIDEVRDDLLARRNLAASVQDWESSGRDVDFLLRGSRLETAEQWQRSSELPLAEDEQAYLAISHRTARTEDERRRRRRRLTVGALVLALVVTLGFSTVATVQRRVADEQVRLTRARALAGEALLSIESDPELGILLALEAVASHRDAQQRPVPEAVSALQAALQATTRVLLDLPGGTEGVAISPDGRLLATDTDEPGELRVVDASTGEEVVGLTGRGAIGAVGFHPDGSLIAVSYLDTGGKPAVETFEVDTWTSRATYDGSPSGYWAVTFTDDGGDHVVGMANDGGATAWSLATGDVTSSLDRAFDLDVVAGSSVVAVTQGAEEVAFVDVRDGRSIETLATPGIAGEAIAVDGSRVAVNSFNGRSVEAWDRDTGSRLDAFSNPSPLTLGWSPDGRLVHTANDGSIRIVEVGTDADELVLRGHSDGVTGLAFAPSGQELASVGWAGETRTWDITPDGPAALHNLSFPDGLIWETVGSPDDERIWVSLNLPGDTQRIEVVDPVASTRTVVVDELWASPWYYAVLAQNASAVAGFDRDRRAHVYDLPSGEPRLQLEPCQTPRAISDDGSLLVVDGQLLCTDQIGAPRLEPPPGARLRSAVLEGRSGEVLIDLGERPLNAAALGPSDSPSANYATLSVDWQTIEIHDVETGRLVGSLGIGPEFTTSMWFSDDGRHLAFGTQSGQVTVLDITAVQQGSSLAEAVVWSFREPSGGVVTHTRISGGRLATSSLSGHVRVYDLADRRLLADLTVQALDPGSLRFTSDGTALHYEDGRTLRRLDLDIDRLTALARSRLTRGLSAEECDRYRLDAASCAPSEAA